MGKFISIVLLALFVPLAVLAEEQTKERLAEPTSQVFKVTVNYGQSMAQMIAAGRYDLVHSLITEYFSIPDWCKGRVERELVLVHLDKRATTDEVMAELDRRGLRPAWIEDLLALGAKFPDFQRKLPIAALSGGMYSLIHHGYPYLTLGLDGGRRLGVVYPGDFWDEDVRFVAVRR